MMRTQHARPVPRAGPEIAKDNCTKAMMSEEQPDFGALQSDRLCAEAEGIFIQPEISMLEYAVTSSTGTAPSD
jgi:hypothetical protein